MRQKHNELRQIRRLVSTATFWTLVGIPVYLMRCKRQSALNAAARLIFHLRRSDHVTDALVSLHLLRVPERIEFKIAVMTYRVLHGDAPRYLGPFTSTADVPGRRALQLDFPPSVAELVRLPPLKSGTLYRNTSSQLPRCSPSGVT